MKVFLRTSEMRLLMILTAAVTICFAVEQPRKRQNDGEMREIISNGTTEFALKLVRSLYQAVQSEQNLIFSPSNIYFTLSMLHLGSAGTTRNQIAQALGLPTNNSQVFEVHQTIKQILQSIQYWNKSYTLTKINIANGIFLQQELKLKLSYVIESQEYYNSRATNVDFIMDQKGAIDLINNWCFNQTEGRIIKIFEDLLDSSTLAVLTSALYFNGKWQEQFRKRDTKTDKFDTGKRTINVPIMNRRGRARYTNNTELKFESICLDYGGHNFSVGFVLPYPDQNLTKLIQNLQPEHVERIFLAQARHVDYKVPRMKFSYSTSLTDSLTYSGLGAIFTDVDLSNMISNLENSIKIDKAVHAAEIEVDEEGTKASSITALQIVPRSGHHLSDSPITFYLNRPFLMMIRHRPTRTIIFIGVVHQPI